MGIYEGFEYAIKNKTPINIEDIECFGGIRVKNDQLEIGLSKHFPLCEQVKTLVHEFFHLSRRYLPFLGTRSKRALRWSEKNIDRDTDMIIACQPILVEYLGRYIETRDNLSTFLAIKRKEIIADAKSKRFEREKQYKFDF